MFEKGNGAKNYNSFQHIIKPRQYTKSACAARIRTSASGNHIIWPSFISHNHHTTTTHRYLYWPQPGSRMPLRSWAPAGWRCGSRRSPRLTAQPPCTHCPGCWEGGGEEEKEREQHVNKLLVCGIKIKYNDSIFLRHVRQLMNNCNVIFRVKHT